MLSQKSLLPPNAFPGLHKLCGTLKGLHDIEEIVSPYFSTIPVPGHWCNTPVSTCPQRFSYMLNLSASGLMSPCSCVPECVVLNLQLGYFAPQWDQLVPAEIDAPEVTHFSQAGAGQNWIRYSPATGQH